MSRTGFRSGISRKHAPKLFVLAESERVFGLEKLMDLHRSFVDDLAFGVPEKPADRIFVGIAVSAVNLDGVVGGVERRSRSNPFGQRGFARISLPLVFHPSGTKPEQLGVIVAGHHLGDHLLNELVLANHLPESLSLLGVFDAGVK